MAAALMRIHDSVAELDCHRETDLHRLAVDLLATCREMVEAEHPLTAAVVRLGASSPAAPSLSRKDMEAWANATAAVADLPLPTVAVIEGHALGTWWELALACDLRIASADAMVGSPEIRGGGMPSAGGTQRLPRAVGPTLALRLLLLGETLPASTALELGLLQRVVPAAEVDACLEEILAGFRSSAPIALAYAKEAVHAGVELSLTEGLRLEADLAALLQTTADREQGIHAFLDRRAPEFLGR